MRKLVPLLPILALLALGASCTQETQNRFSRGIQNWTGTDGVLEIYAGGKLVRRFLEIDKLTTATSTGAGKNIPRAYRFGYGVLDANLNGVKDKGEAKVYFEFSDYSTQYVFFEAKGLLAERANAAIPPPAKKPATP